MANDMVTITISRAELEKKIGARKAQALLGGIDGDASIKLTHENLVTAQKILAGEKVGPQSGKALPVFRAFFKKKPQTKKACLAFIEEMGQAMNASSDRSVTV